MKGIVLAGGTGSRLWPLTIAVSKQLLPVYNKPLIHYPISTLMLAGIREILVITTPQDQDQFIRLLSDGSQYGVEFKFAVQDAPNGLAEAFIIGENFIGKDSVCLILGDNIFHGPGLGENLQMIHSTNEATIFAYSVQNPNRYGVIEFDVSGKAISIEEKPTNPKSRFAVPGLYFYNNSVIDVAKKISPSARGELEITSINDWYLKLNQLEVSLIPRGTTWFDSGTFDDLQNASQYVQVIEKRQGNRIACLEEIAWRKGWIETEELLTLADRFGENHPVKNYLYDLVHA